MNSINTKLFNLIVSRNGTRGILILIAAITIFFGYNLKHLEFDYQFEKLFPKNDPETRIFKDHMDQFNNQSDFLFILIEDSSSFFQPKLIKQIREFDQKLQDDSLVISTTSATSAMKMSWGSFGIVTSPMLGSTREQLILDSTNLISHPVYGQFFGNNGKSVFINVRHHRNNSLSEAFLERVKKYAAEEGIEDFMLVGPAQAQIGFIKIIKRNFVTFLLASVLLSFSLLFFLFRDIKSAILPFGLSVLCTIWLFGFIGASGYKIDILSSLLPPIVFFVSVSDIIHLMNGLGKSSKVTRKERLLDAMNMAFGPTLLTSVTTSIGFLSLIWINTEPIQQLGFFASIGVLFAFILTYSFGIIFLLIFKTNSYLKVQIPSNYSTFIMNKSKWIYVSFLILLGLAIPGITLISTNAYILDDMPEKSQLRTEFEHVSNLIGGVRTVEVRVELKSKAVGFENDEIIRNLEKIQIFLEDSMGVTKTQSLISGLKSANCILNENVPVAYVIPTNDKIKGTINFLKTLGGWDQFISEDGIATYFLGYTLDNGTDHSLAQYEKFDDFKSKNIDSNLLDVFITGPSYLIDKTNSRLSANLLKGLASAILAIAIFLGIYFRSWKLLFISLIPNMLPLLLIAGIIGWAGISLKMTSAILFTIAFGIAVDDTIHFISYYMQNIRSGTPMEDTFNHAGSAMVVTTLVMISGFGIFMFSNFSATFFMGFFVSSALFIALLIDFTLLPLLLNRFIKK